METCVGTYFSMLETYLEHNINIFKNLLLAVSQQIYHYMAVNILLVVLLLLTLQTCALKLAPHQISWDGVWVMGVGLGSWVWVLGHGLWGSWGVWGKY